MNIDDLAIEFYKDFEKEYINTSKVAYLDYHPWIKHEYKHKFLPKVEFRRKDPVCIIKLKHTNLWLYENDNKFIFKELQCGNFDHIHPLIFWIEHLKERTFLLYKTVHFGITDKYYLKYIEKNGFIYMKWESNISNATVFSHDERVRWREYHADLVSSQKKF